MQVEMARKNVQLNLYQKNMDIKPKTTRDGEGHYIMEKGSIQQEAVSLANIQAPKVGAPTQLKQVLTDLRGRQKQHVLKGLRHLALNSGLIIGEETSKETLPLTQHLDQTDLRTVTERSVQSHQNPSTFFSSARATFPRIEQVLGHKTSLDKFKKITIISSKFSSHNCA